MASFKPIPEFPDYFISRDVGGEVVNKEGRIYKQRQNKAGNSVIELLKKNRLVKNLMYSAHVGELRKGYVIEVKDGVDRTSFSLEDLQEIGPEEEEAAIDKQKSKLLLEGWRFHPVYSLYGANAEGKTWTLLKGGKEKVGTVKDGYVYFKLKISLRSSLKKSYSKDRFVWEAWNSKILNHNIDIHHVNGDSLNNSIINLMPLTRQEHNRITFSESATRSTALREAASKQILCYHAQNPDDRTVYDSYQAASRATGVDRRIIGESIGSEIKGYIFENVETKTIDGEIWKPVRNAEVSNKGRIKRSNTVSFGCKRHDGELVAHFQDPNSAKKKIERIPIKRLVCEVFNGPPPSSAHEFVRRIDKSKTNNCSENLTWATKSDCATQAKNVRKIVVCFKDNGEIFTVEGNQFEFESISAVIRYMETFNNVKFDHHSIRNACKYGKVCSKRVNGRPVDFFYASELRIDTTDVDKPFLISSSRIDSIDKRKSTI